jgi:hypothetical protein
LPSEWRSARLRGFRAPLDPSSTATRERCRVAPGMSCDSSSVAAMKEVKRRTWGAV